VTCTFSPSSGGATPPLPDTYSLPRVSLVEDRDKRTFTAKCLLSHSAGIASNMVSLVARDYVVTTTDEANKLVDDIIDYAKNVILQKYRDRIKIPDIREGFEKKVEC
jgi:hypothetical protein